MKHSLQKGVLMAYPLARYARIAALLGAVTSACFASAPENINPALAGVAAGTANVSALATPIEMKSPLASVQGEVQPSVPAQPQQWCLCDLTIEDTIFLEQYDLQ